MNNKLSNILKVVESYDSDRIFDFIFNDNFKIRYSDFEMVDESIYNSKDYCVAKIADEEKYVEFKVNEIAKIVDAENGEVLYDSDF